jgi:hypothetical protein
MGAVRGSMAIGTGSFQRYLLCIHAAPRTHNEKGPQREATGLRSDEVATQGPSTPVTRSRSFASVMWGRSLDAMLTSQVGMLPPMSDSAW